MFPVPAPAGILAAHAHRRDPGSPPARGFAGRSTPARFTRDGARALEGFVVFAPLSSPTERGASADTGREASGYRRRLPRARKSRRVWREPQSSLLIRGG